MTEKMDNFTASPKAGVPTGSERVMGSPISIVREFFPEASDEFADYVIWGRTGFPTFWTTNDPVAEFRASVARFKRALRHSRGVMCEFCLRPALSKAWLCRRCKKAMDRDQRATPPLQVGTPAGQKP